MLKGAGAGFGYNAVFSNCQETEKQPKRNRKENRKAFKTHSLNVFLCFLFFVLRFNAFRYPFRWLFGAKKILDFQRFANITQTLDFQRF